MSTLETIRTLRYVFQSRETYIKEPITSPEILSEPFPPQKQEDSINTVQETLNSQFRLVLLVPPYMPCTSSLEFVNCSLSTTRLISRCNTSSQREEFLLGSPKLFSPILGEGKGYTTKVIYT